MSQSEVSESERSTQSPPVSPRDEEEDVQQADAGAGGEAAPLAVQPVLGGEDAPAAAPVMEAGEEIEMVELQDDELESMAGSQDGSQAGSQGSGSSQQSVSGEVLTVVPL